MKEMIEQSKNREEDYEINRYPNKEKLVLNALLSVMEDEDPLVLKIWLKYNDKLFSHIRKLFVR